MEAKLGIPSAFPKNRLGVKNSLDCSSQIYATYVVVGQNLNTTEAANAVGVDRATLQRWIHERKVNPPKTILRNGRGVRLWSSSDIERLSRVKELVYRRGRGRKPKPKA